MNTLYLVTFYLILNTAWAAISSPPFPTNMACQIGEPCEAIYQESWDGMKDKNTVVFRQGDCGATKDNFDVKAPSSTEATSTKIKATITFAEVDVGTWFMCVCADKDQVDSSEVTCAANTENIKHFRHKVVTVSIKGAVSRPSPNTSTQTCQPNTDCMFELASIWTGQTYGDKLVLYDGECGVSSGLMVAAQILTSWPTATTKSSWILSIPDDSVRVAPYNICMCPFKKVTCPDLTATSSGQDKVLYEYKVGSILVATGPVEPTAQAPSGASTIAVPLLLVASVWALL